MNALADKVHKQEVPCTQYVLHTMPATLFTNHPYISSSSTSVGTKIYCYLCSDGCWIMLPAWYGVHIIVCMALLAYVCVFCHPVRPYLYIS